MTFPRSAMPSIPTKTPLICHQSILTGFWKPLLQHFQDDSVWVHPLGVLLRMGGETFANYSFSFADKLLPLSSSYKGCSSESHSRGRSKEESPSVSISPWYSGESRIISQIDPNFFLGNGGKRRHPRAQPKRMLLPFSQLSPSAGARIPTENRIALPVLVSGSFSKMEGGSTSPRWTPLLRRKIWKDPFPGLFSGGEIGKILIWIILCLAASLRRAPRPLTEYAHWDTYSTIYLEVYTYRSRAVKGLTLIVEHLLHHSFSSVSFLANAADSRVHMDPNSLISLGIKHLSILRRHIFAYFEADLHPLIFHELTYL